MKEDAMLQRLALAGVTATVMALSFALAQAASPNGVKTLDPPGAIKAEGTWSLGARAGDFIFVAGMQGIDPATNRLVQDPQARIRQALLNIGLIAQSEGASLQDCVRLTVYVSDLRRFAPMVDKAQAEIWAKPPYPPRTMVEVQRLFDDDIVEIDSVLRPAAKVTMIGGRSIQRHVCLWPLADIQLSPGNVPFQGEVKRPLSKLSLIGLDE
ncbi:MAG: RidA family protein [Xanthobacteraceae bacterium]